MANMQAPVLTITFDGLPSNFSAMEQLGANLNLDYIKFGTYIQPYILHPSTGAKIFIFPDPSHMFKLLRNSFKAHRILYHNGNVRKYVMLLIPVIVYLFCILEDRVELFNTTGRPPNTKWPPSRK
jgi:hypothetical protein